MCCSARRDASKGVYRVGRSNCLWSKPTFQCRTCVWFLWVCVFMCVCLCMCLCLCICSVSSFCYELSTLKWFCFQLSRLVPCLFTLLCNSQEKRGVTGVTFKVCACGFMQHIDTVIQMLWWDSDVIQTTLFTRTFSSFFYQFVSSLQSNLNECSSTTKTNY